jgi:xanthine/uracil/vitamin C permease (AzgA family)
MELLGAVAAIMGIVGFAVGVIRFVNRRTHVSIATLTGLLLAYVCMVALQRFSLDLVASCIGIGSGFVASAKFFHERSRLGKFLIGILLTIVFIVLGYLGLVVYIMLKVFMCGLLTLIYFFLLGWFLEDNEEVFDDCLQNLSLF